jgi:hypothetical protein
MYSDETNNFLLTMGGNELNSWDGNNQFKLVLCSKSHKDYIWGFTVFN